MDYKKYFFHYSDSISELLKKVDTNLINDSVNLIANTKKNKNKIYIVGNGGSSSIASHVSVDFAKSANVKSSTFNNANLITCFANDYGYENWVKEAIKTIPIGSAGIIFNPGTSDALPRPNNSIALSPLVEISAPDSFRLCSAWAYPFK